MIWIIGEYAERIDNADELLESFLGTHCLSILRINHTNDCFLTLLLCFNRIYCVLFITVPVESFIEETSMVQLQLLTATVKLFLKQPETSQVRLLLRFYFAQIVAFIHSFFYS